MTYLLVMTCSSTPMFISFHDESPGWDSWELMNLIIDCFFGVDIIVTFFSAFYDVRKLTFQNRPLWTYWNRIM